MFEPMNNKKIKTNAAIGICAMLILLVVPIYPVYSAEEGKVVYPLKYRNWHHTKSMLIDEKHPLFETFGGIHHIYANEKALRAIRSDSEYADGSVFVFDLLVAVAFNGGISEGKRRRLDVMEKNRTKFSSTGGWGFESFEGSTQQRVDQNVVEKCYSCHEPQVDKGYVFSDYRN
jgi:hypothetical protein